MPTDPARVAALKAQLAALSAELDELTAEPESDAAPTVPTVTVHSQIIPGQTKWTAPPPQTVEDALAAVRRRHGKTRSERVAEANGIGSDTATEGGELTGAAAGIAAAQRRHGRR